MLSRLNSMTAMSAMTVMTAMTRVVPRWSTQITRNAKNLSTVIARDAFLPTRSMALKDFIYSSPVLSCTKRPESRRNLNAVDGGRIYRMYFSAAFHPLQQNSPITSTLFLSTPSRASSTMKKRRMKMNKHKLRKRRKALRMNTKVSRE